LPVIALIDRCVVAGFVYLGAHELAGQDLGVLGIVDETLEPGGRSGTDRRWCRLSGFVLAEIGARGVAQAGTAQVPAAVVGHPAVAGGRGGPGEALGRALGDRIEEIGRNDEVCTHDSSVPCSTANL